MGMLGSGNMVAGSEGRPHKRGGKESKPGGGETGGCIAGRKLGVCFKPRERGDEWEVVENSENFYPVD